MSHNKRHTEYNEYRRIESLETEKQLVINLSSKEYKMLSNLIRRINTWSALGIETTEGFVSPKHSLHKGLLMAKKIVSLYEKAGIEADDWHKHWSYNRQHQLTLGKEYQSMEAPERKDNKTSINRGSGDSNKNRIRYPKKCRKTAWKRFYKLFPHLNPDNKK